MSASRKIVKVFLGSPGDLKDERRAAKQVVDEFNKQWADNLGVHVELVGWEDTFSKFGRPQEIINRDLDQCELFVGIMWKLWGSPPDLDGPYTSGFEEEFERSVASRKKLNRPEINLLFKNIDPELAKDPGEALKKVLEFKNRIAAEKSILYQTFDNLREFEAHVRGCITDYVQNLKKEEDQKITDETQAQPAASPSKDPVLNPLSAEGATFLREFITKAEQNNNGNPFSPFDVARFRLLAGMVSTPGIEEATIGVHDANILFVSRSNNELSHHEKRGLLECALDNFGGENVPLWHWYAAVSEKSPDYLAIATIVGPTARRIGALGTLRLLSARVADIRNLDDTVLWHRNEFVKEWLNATIDPKIKVAALEYLSAAGVPDDLQHIKSELSTGHYQTIGPAIEAAISINLRQSRESALNFLYESQPESIREHLMERLFARPETIPTSLLAPAATHRSPKVRKIAVPVLAARGALEMSVAEQLLTDTEAAIRYSALLALEGFGLKFTDERVRAILVKPINRGFNGLLNYTSKEDKEGEEYHRLYLTQKLRKMSGAEIEQLARAESVFDRSARLALIFRNFSTQGRLLRQSLDDRFKTEFEADLKAMEGKHLIDGEMAEKIRSVEETIRKKFSRQALDILCEKNAPEDITRVRKALEDEYVEFSLLDVAYLAKHGEWSDIALLVKLAERSTSSILLGIDTDKADALASAIYALGKRRLEDLVTLDMPYGLLPKILVKISESEWASLSDDQIIALLLSSVDTLRKAVVLKVIRSCSKRRLKNILNRYLEIKGYRFYNVIYWLDAAVSLPQSQARKIAQSALISLR